MSEHPSLFLGTNQGLPEHVIPHIEMIVGDTDLRQTLMCGDSDRIVGRELAWYVTHSSSIPGIS